MSALIAGERCGRLRCSDSWRCLSPAALTTSSSPDLGARNTIELTWINPVGKCRGKSTWSDRLTVPTSKDADMPDHGLAKVAIVDDDPSVRDSLKFLIEIVGHPVQTFESAIAFLKAGAEQFNRLILDHHMPHMTGLELVERLRETGPAIPIMLITGSLSADMMEKANWLGIACVLEKPPSEQEIINFIASDQH